MSMHLELGLDTFGDVTRGADGRPLSHAQVIRDVVAEAVLADELGIDFIGLGEHHREDFAISTPDVVLAAIAGRTERIRLGSSVTVLSSDDPVRVFERFSTLDAVSGGRAEIILGRGSFTESFPLFGYPLEQYATLFEEKLELFAAILEQDRTGEPVTWRGTTRPALDRQRVFPRTEHGALKVWIGVGGSPESVVRAARYGMPLMLAIIGGDPRRFAPYVELYHRALAQRGAPRLPVGVHSPGYVAESDARARAEFWPPYREMRDRIGAERRWPPITPAEFEREIEAGSLYVGSPETVARKIAATARALGLARFDLKYSAGPLAHDLLLRCIELYGGDVVPRVHELLAESGR
ncbi:MAG TPA: LLM class flavin-dependent oxidoreductase [Longimicrobiales bacterium]|nr:LLM class flavin-dependent oxidoreductase [Longimicrobiales bacterium]